MKNRINSKHCSKKQRKSSRHFNIFLGQYQHFHTPESVEEKRFLNGEWPFGGSYR